MPDAFVFAIVLTFLTSFLSFSILGTSFFKIVDSWYKGFWNLLEFGMQMVLLIVTGYSIAISPFVNRLINNLSNVIKTPNQVYYFVTLFGIFGLIIAIPVYTTIKVIYNSFFDTKKLMVNLFK